MKLWLLRPVEPRSPWDDPWKPWYDKAFGFIIRAETEAQARQVANANAGNENGGGFLDNKTADANEPWLNSKYSTCEPLVEAGEAGIVMQDFRAA